MYAANIDTAGYCDSYGSFRGCVDASEHVQRLGWYASRWCERDTVLVKDSVLVSIFSAGDTVYKTREVWRWRDRTNVRVDTAYKSAVRVDTVRVPVAVERKLSWWERTVERPFKQVIVAFVGLGAIFGVLDVAVRLRQRRSKDTEKDE